MHRRRFLQLFGAAAPGALIIPKLGLSEVARKFFFAPKQGWHKSWTMHALPGRIDGLSLKHWYRVHEGKINFYEVDGQTVFPVYKANGGLARANVVYTMGPAVIIPGEIPVPDFMKDLSIA